MMKTELVSDRELSDGNDSDISDSNEHKHESSIDLGKTIKKRAVFNRTKWSAAEERAIINDPFLEKPSSQCINQMLKTVLMHMKAMLVCRIGQYAKQNQVWNMIMKNQKQS